MINSPFSNEVFMNIWMKYFKNCDHPITFKFINGVKFYKNKIFPLYVNVGKNITNGIFYKINEGNTDFRGKTFLIFDIPQYFGLNQESNENFKIKTARQYSGCLVSLSDFNSFNEYFKFNFRSKGRYLYRRSLSRLEKCCNIEYKIYSEFIDNKEYEYLFDNMISLIKQRFESLGLDNDIVSLNEYYRELAYKMILSKNAVLIAISNNGKPISISICFLSDKIMFFAITSFDINYYRFNLGHITIMKLLSWCFENKIEILDFSKGSYDYKKRWSNQEYNFECHILYDPKSFYSSIIAFFVHSFYSVKQYLRDRKVNYIVSKIKFLLKGSKISTLKNRYKILDLEDYTVKTEKLKEIDFFNKEYEFLVLPLFDHLYNNPEKISKLNFYKDSEKKDSYFVIGKTTNINIVGS